MVIYKFECVHCRQKYQRSFDDDDAPRNKRTKWLFDTEYSTTCKKCGAVNIAHTIKFELKNVNMEVK